jgi:NADPH:quinone reductase-like Zn-dependent oxidoreductase
LVTFIEEKDVKPVIDQRVFGLGDLKDALVYLEDQRHFSKVVIKIG